MKHVKLIGLMLVAVFAISAAAAASASAQQWLINGAAITSPKAVNSKSVGKILLADTKAPSGGTYIECEGTDKGTVGPGAKDELTAVTATNCNFVTGKSGSCESSKPVTAKALNLPWVTELLTVGGKIVDMVKAKNGKGVGYLVECTVLGVFKVQDECTKTEIETEMSNVTGGVDATFKEAEKTNCSLGGTEAGIAKGVDLNENPSKSEVLTVK